MKTKEQNSSKGAFSCIYDFNRKYVDTTKSKVKIRVKPLSGDKGFTIYLDWYEGSEKVTDTDGKSKVKTLHKYCFDFPGAGRLYLVKCGRYDTQEREMNDQAWGAAVAYRNRCLENLMKGLPAFITKSELDSQDNFIAFARQEQRKEEGRVASDNFNVAIMHLLNYEFMKQGKFKDFTKFCEFCEKNPLIPFSRITPTYVTNFIEYLRTARSYRKNADGVGKPLSANTAKQIQSYFNTLLNRAVANKDVNLTENPFKHVTNVLKPVKPEIQYLTKEEVQALIDKDCRREVLKNAFLFSCFTGLRFSDVTKLTWNNVDGSVLRYKQQKTNEKVVTGIPDVAKRFLPEFAGDKNALLFNIHYTYQISRDLQQWMESAGIKKRIRFHSSRHTCAVLLLDSGANMYLTSQMLGHASMRTTERYYADIIDKRKEEAAENLNKYLNF